MTTKPTLPISILSLALLLGSGGCAGKASLRMLPNDVGVPARYSAPVDEVAAAAPVAVDELGYGSLEWATPDSTQTVLLASKGWNLFTGFGESMRVRVEAADGTTLVRIAGRPNYALDISGRADRDAVRVVAGLDRALGPRALLPEVGTRVRGHTATGAALEGEVVSGSDGRIDVRWQDGALGFPSDARDLEILRGSWDHGRTGALVGFAVGALVSLGGALGDCPISPFAQECEASPAWLMAIPVGGLLGYALGRHSLTEVWSAWNPGQR